MRALILHANKFATEVIAKSNWPTGIEPENRKSPFEEMNNCIVVFFCVEKNDTQEQLEELYKEILKTCDEVNTFISEFVAGHQRTSRFIQI